MRAIALALGLLVAGCGETPQEAAYREAGEAEQMAQRAEKAGDKPGECRERQRKVDALRRAGSNRYAGEAAVTRLLCDRYDAECDQPSFGFRSHQANAS